MSISSITDNINTITGKSTGNSVVDDNYQQFLHLLTTQLQNQDPTDPTDTNALTQQIATLSQVEQQINTNKNLEQLISLYNATQFNSLVNYIGKQIEADGNLGALQGGRAQFAYYLEKEAENVAVTVTDDKGAVVYSGSGTKVAGRNVYTWNGKNADGAQMPDGVYSIKVEAKDASNNTINSKTYTTGVVTSIDSADGTVYLSIGDLSIPLAKVLSIREAKA